MYLRTCLLATTVTLLFAGCAGEARPFTLGLIPSDQTAEMQKHADALEVFLSKQMGQKVDVVVPTAYEPLIEALRFGHIDAAYMDAGPALIATERANAEVVLAETNAGKATYNAEVFVQSGSSIRQLSDVVGKRVAFTSITGASGFLFPVGTLVKQGLITPDGQDLPALEKALDTAFEKHVFSGGYQQSLTLLLDGSVDVAPGADTAPARLLTPEQRSRIVSIARLGLVPSHPVVVRKDLDSQTRAAFVAAMLALNEPENVQVLKDLYGVDGMIATSGEEHLRDFAPVFQTLTGIHQSLLEKKRK